MHYALFRHSLLVLLIVPVFFGLLITWKRPTWSAKLVKLSRPLFMFMMVIVSTLGLYTNRFFFSVVAWYDLVSASCLGLSGYIVGMIFSAILCLNRKQIIALSLETAIQVTSDNLDSQNLFWCILEDKISLLKPF